MKYVALSQPGATLVAMGIRNAVRIEERLRKKTWRLYIYATKPVVNNAEFPLEWVQEAFNQEQYGNLPPIEELPVNALIGFFDWFSLSSSFEKESIWSAGTEDPVYIVCNAHMFDVPVFLPPEIIDNIDDIDELVPCHKCRPKSPHLLTFEDELYLDVSDKNFAIASRGGSFTLEYTAAIANLLEGKLDDIKSITLLNGIKSKTFMFKADLIYDYVDDNQQNLKMYPSVLSPDGKIFRAQLMLSFDEPLIE